MDTQESDVAVVKQLFTRGDVSAYFALFLDNTSTIILLGTTLTGINSDLGSIYFQSVLPGIGLSVIFGNIFYSYQAYTNLMADDKKLTITAQPYGMNTPASFFSAFSLVVPLLFKYLGEGMSSYAAAEKAWQVSCTANFCMGLIEILGALAGHWIRKYVPKVALLTTVSGIAYVFLALNPFIEVARDPLIAFAPLMLIFCWFFAKVDNKFVPTSVIALAIGTISGWATGTQTSGYVTQTFSDWGAVNMKFTLFDNFRNMGEVVNYLNIIVPIGIANFVETIENVESASLSGDEYDVTLTMVADGIGTLVGASFGSMFPTTVYVGHYSYKKMGASIGYSLYNGITVCSLCMLNIVPIIIALIPKEAILTVLLVVGLLILLQTLETFDNKYYPAVLFGVLPIICEWADTVGANSGSPAEVGMKNMAKGAILNSIMLTSIFVYIIDKEFLLAATYALTSAVFCFFGLMHSSELGIYWEIEKTEFRYCLSYIISAVFFVIIYYITKEQVQADGESENDLKDKKVENDIV